MVLGIYVKSWHLSEEQFSTAQLPNQRARQDSKARLRLFLFSLAVCRPVTAMHKAVCRSKQAGNPFVEVLAPITNHETQSST